MDTVAHKIEKLARELILEIDKADLESQSLVNKVREAKIFLSALDKGRKDKGLVVEFEKMEVQDDEI